MALYAVDEDDLIFAGHAEKGKIYWCLGCFGPVKRRIGKERFPHFYHVKSAPHCKLYSKSEDHLWAQLELQRLFPPGELQIERPFTDIDRVADLCWEKEKIIFEIQCSPLTPKEGEMRVRDYRSIGYEIVWLLDDKRYNKRIIRPAEDFLRRYPTYFFSVRQSIYYDQFEIFSGTRRVKKGKKLLLDLQKLRRMPPVRFDEKTFPEQILNHEKTLYFANDRIDRALRARFHPYGKLNMQNWKALERLFVEKKPNPLKRWLYRYLLYPYLGWLEKTLRRVR